LVSKISNFQQKKKKNNVYIGRYFVFIIINAGKCQMCQTDPADRPSFPFAKKL